MLILTALLPADASAVNGKKVCHSSWCYKVENIEGWTVYYSESFVNADKVHIQKVKRQLAQDLNYISKQVPANTLRKMKKIRIHISLFDPSGRATLGIYHYSKEVLTSRKQDPSKFESIEIANTTNYLKYASSQPAVILHELGHAFIHQFLSGAERNKLESVYNYAVASKKYEKVSYFDGAKYHYRKAYALKDFYEHFCEILEAYYWRNDYFPFNRGELKAHDTSGYRFIKSVVGN